MYEIRLLFEKTEKANTWSLRLERDRDQPSKAGDFSPFLTDDDYEDLRWYLEDYMDLPDAGARIRAERIERNLLSWGRRLHDALFDADAQSGRFRDRLLSAAGPRLLTIATDESDLLRMPWELVANERGPLSRQGVTVRRQLASVEEVRSFTVGRPLRILLVVSRPDDTGFIDPRFTTRAMLDALAPLGSRVQVDFCEPPTLAEMNQRLERASRDRRPYHIVHFDGHGTFLPELGLGALCYEQRDDGSGNVKTDFVRADQLGSLLAGYELPLVILEACRSGAVSRLPAFRSVAPRLLHAGVGSVLAMSHSVHVEAARILLARFYEQLVDSATVGQALEAARGALIADARRWRELGPAAPSVELSDWFLPTLYQRGEDLQIVPPPTDGPGSPAPAGPSAGPSVGRLPSGFPRAPLHQFHGRARELHRLERAFRLHRSVLLHAMGGMGKTTLAREAAFWWTRTGTFADGACFVSFEQGIGAEQVVSALGTYLDGESFQALPPPQQRARAVELFRSRRVLLVWDNLESVLPQFADRDAPLFDADKRGQLIELYHDLTEDSGKGRLLITCRPAETPLAGAVKFPLAGLSRPDSLYLLAQVLSKEGIGLDDAQHGGRAEIEGLLDVLADHPLSIELVGRHLKTMPPAAIVSDFEALLAQFHGDAEVERNRSLLASLRFSTQRLSDPAQAMLPWLGLFRGGVFEDVLLDISQLDPPAWEAARAELEATALIRVERDLLFANRPYLRFHPTLPWATQGAPSRDESVRARYVDVYLGVMGAVDRALTGQDPRGGMEVLSREEPNYRAAVAWALAAGRSDTAAYLGDTLSTYLRMSGRLRERHAWVAWVAQEVGSRGFTESAASTERQAAWALYMQGHPNAAFERLQALHTRLLATPEFDTAFQLACTERTLGRVLLLSGQPSAAQPLFKKAIARFEALIKTQTSAGQDVGTVRGNVTAGLGDLADALQASGQLAEARSAAERGLEINRELGRVHAVAAGLGRLAQIDMADGQYAAADARYDEAIAAAKNAGDKELEAIGLQQQGSLADDMSQFDRAAALYQRALKLFQEMGNDGGILNTCNLLGVVERKQGRLDEARAWYERSRDLALARGDRYFVGGSAQNLGILCQKEGEAALARQDAAAAEAHFAQAERWLTECLQVMRDLGNKSREAAAWGQLAQLFLLRKDLDQAEAHAHRAREIREPLGMKEVVNNYATLTQIARARGNEAEAARWQKKYDDLQAELQRRAQGDSPFPPQLLKALQNLAVACAQHAVNKPAAPLDPQVEEALVRVSMFPAPLDALAPFLRALAAGTPVPIPAGLPPPLPELFAQLLDALRQTRR